MLIMVNRGMSHENMMLDDLWVSNESSLDVYLDEVN